MQTNGPKSAKNRWTEQNSLEMNVSRTQARQTRLKIQVRTWYIAKVPPTADLNSKPRTLNTWEMATFQFLARHRLHKAMVVIHLRPPIQTRYKTKRLTTDNTQEFKATSAPSSNEQTTMLSIKGQEISLKILTMDFKIIKADHIHINNNSITGSAQLHHKYPSLKTKSNLTNLFAHREEAKATEYQPKASNTVKSHERRITITLSNNGKIMANRLQCSCNNTVTNSNSKSALVWLPAPTSQITSAQVKVTTQSITMLVVSSGSLLEPQE